MLLQFNKIHLAHYTPQNPVSVNSMAPQHLEHTQLILKAGPYSFRKRSVLIYRSPVLGSTVTIRLPSDSGRRAT